VNPRPHQTNVAHGTVRIVATAVASLLAISSAGAIQSDGRYRERILYTFDDKTGLSPSDSLIADAAGALYGTALGGGVGAGVAFKLTPNGGGYVESVLHSFGGNPSDGAAPESGLTIDADGSLYGTTEFGGGSGCDEGGCGTVYKLTPTASGYAETILYNFRGNGDGALPFGNLILDASGALYGTTSEGGSGNDQLCGGGVGGCGTIFKLTPSGSGTYSEQLIHEFVDPFDGTIPIGGLIEDENDGALYGTTAYGGIANPRCYPGSPLGCGTVFKLDLGAGYPLTVLHRFTAGRDGAAPFSSLLRDGRGALYGTTTLGGSLHCDEAHQFKGCGTIFRLAPRSGGFAETILHRFRGGPDGKKPYDALIENDAGSFYGTTAYGGERSRSAPSGSGTVFTMTVSNGTFSERSIYEFHDGADGSHPLGGLLLRHRVLYGTTSGGGEASNCPYGCGIVFSLSLP
jgi:uncharacterized repeat protein (TIGR03803 family)